MTDQYVHPRLLKHWRGMLNINNGPIRSAYHAIMFAVLEPFLGGEQ